MKNLCTFCCKIIFKNNDMCFCGSLNAERSNSTVPAKVLPNMKFVDYLALQSKVSKGAFAFWMRRWGAKPR